MATQTLRSVVPALSPDDGARALEQLLARRGYRIEERVAHTPGRQLLDLQAALRPGMRLLTQSSAPARSGPGAWVLDETLGPGTAGDGWDMARRLSADLGAFVAHAQMRRQASHFEHGLFLAGRTVVMERDMAEAAAQAALDEDYRRLSGWPATDLRWSVDQPLATLVVSGVPADAAAATPQPPPALALALFALAEEPAFAEQWAARADAARSAGWRWQAALTDTELPYVVLARDGGVDAVLFDELARALDVPAVMVTLDEGGFDWRVRQPGAAVEAGRGHGSDELLRRLAAATSAIGACPGVIRVG